MIEKIRTDYENVKEFTGNISHEIQTPLSVIRLKSDLLLQTSPLNSEQANLIRDIQKTNSRLSKLNKTLVLFTKIDNNQFPIKEKISLTEVVETAPGDLFLHCRSQKYINRLPQERRFFD